MARLLRVFRQARKGVLSRFKDCFVIIEQPHTLTGTPKPLYFKEHNTPTRFARFMNKIITFTSEDKPHPDFF